MRYQITSYQLLMKMLSEEMPPGDACLEWPRARGPEGYGIVAIVDGNWKAAHRLADAKSNGPIPPGVCVLHKCDNPPCFRPSHLFRGGRADNNRDMLQKGRGKMRGALKISDADVLAIRAEGIIGTAHHPGNALEIARKYNTTRITIYRILRRLRRTSY